MLEIYQPAIFDGYPIVAGITKRSSNLDFPQHGFTFRNTAFLSEQEFSIHQSALALNIGNGIGASIFSCKQVHGDTILQTEQWYINSEADGLSTNHRQQTLCIAVADCCGIILYDPELSCLATLHSGWRGAALNIAKKGVMHLESNYNALPKQLLAWLSPCAGADVYEVGEEVAQLFPGFFLPAKLQGKYHLDLRGAIVQSLLEVGLQRENIEVSSECTITNQAFHSYRRDGAKGRNVVFASML